MKSPSFETDAKGRAAENYSGSLMLLMPSSHPGTDRLLAFYQALDQNEPLENPAEEQCDTPRVPKVIEIAINAYEKGITASASDVGSRSDCYVLVKARCPLAFG